MGLFQNARDNIMHFQDSSLTAVSGDQNIGGPVTMAGPQNFAGNQNIYQGVPLKGVLFPLEFVRLTV